MNTLTPLTNRLDSLEEKHFPKGKEVVLTTDYVHFALSPIKTKDFGKQPLLLEKFIPCLNGKPLEKPKQKKYKIANAHEIGGGSYKWTVIGSGQSHLFDLKEYQQAEADCLFEGWELSEETYAIQKGNMFIYFMPDNMYSSTGHDIKIIRFYAYSDTIIEDVAEYNLISELSVNWLRVFCQK